MSMRTVYPEQLLIHDPEIVVMDTEEKSAALFELIGMAITTMTEYYPDDPPFVYVRIPAVV